MSYGLPRRYLTFISLLWILATVNVCVARAGEKSQEQPLEKVRIAYSSISANQVPAWVAHEKGFFRKNALDVELIFIESGTRAVNALISGDVAFSQMAGSSVLPTNLQGQDVVIVAGFVNTMDYQLVAHQSITQPSHLKGKTLAVSQFGSSSDFATRYALDKYGLVPEKDVTILEIGTQPARLAAFQSGKIQAAMVTVPLTLKAKSMGFHTLADLQMLGLEYQHTALVTTRSLIKSKPNLVRHAVKALVEGVHYYKTHRREALAILKKYLGEHDPEAFVEAYESIGLALIPEKPYPTLRGIQIMLRELSGKDPRARTARPEQFVDMTFVKELDNSSFIDRLYKSQPVVATHEHARPLPASVTVEEKASPVKDRAKPVDAPAILVIPSTLAGASGLPQEYIVKAGDTLSHLARRFYGSSDKWAKIYEANAKMMKNPDHLYIGQPLVIPADPGPGT